MGAVVAVVAVLAVETAETGRGWTRAGDAAIAARPGLANRRTAGGRRGQWRRGRRRAVWALETLHALDAEVGNVAGGRGLARCKRGRAARLVLGGIGQPRCRPEGSRAGAGAGREVWQAAVLSTTLRSRRVGCARRRTSRGGRRRRWSCWARMPQGRAHATRRAQGCCVASTAPRRPIRQPRRWCGGGYSGLRADEVAARRRRGLGGPGGADGARSQGAGTRTGRVGRRGGSDGGAAGLEWRRRCAGSC